MNDIVTKKRERRDKHINREKELRQGRERNRARGMNDIVTKTERRAIDKK
jgi:hypothetical protein